MATKVTTAPTVEPITLAEAKAQCRVEVDDDDDFLTGLIVAARRHCEKIDWRAYITQTLATWLDAWPDDGVIYVPRPPLQSVTSVVYYNAADTPATLSAASYFVDTISQPGRIVLRTGSTWPTTTLRAANGICITHVAGYGLAAAVPEDIKSAMKLLIGHWYENREDSTVGAVSRSIEFGVRSLLGIDRAMRF